MDNSHIMVIVLALSIFSIMGLTSGFIIYDNCPPHIRAIDDVKNCHTLLIVCLVFIILFDIVYFSWHILHNHKAITFKHDTRMGHHM